MIVRHVHQALIALVLFLALEGAGYAGSFQVSPVRATLTATQPVVALKVRNTGDAATVVQLQVMRWTQSDNKDALVPAGELLATPPIFTLAPGATQIIRVGSRQPADARVERAYRLLLEEVPPPPEPGFTGLRIALKLSLPVFVAPTTAASAKLQWHAVAAADGALLLTTHNAGNAHAHVSDLTVTASNTHVPLPDTNLYVLPGATRQWHMSMRVAPGQLLHLAGHDGGNAVRADVIVADP